MFLQLLEQRLTLQKLIEELPPNDYHLTEEGRALIGQINPLSAKIRSLGQAWLIRKRNQNNRVNAYEAKQHFSAGYFSRKF